MKELAAALQNMNEVLKSSDALLASSDWTRRVEDFNRSADARMQVAAEQGQIVVRAGFRQLWLTLAALFVLFVLYRLGAFYLFRPVSARRTRAEALTGPDARKVEVGAEGGNGRAAVAGPNA